jgi:hypothetical protein
MSPPSSLLRFCRKNKRSFFPIDAPFVGWRRITFGYADRRCGAKFAARPTESWNDERHNNDLAATRGDGEIGGSRTDAV